MGVRCCVIKGRCGTVRCECPSGMAKLHIRSGDNARVSLDLLCFDCLPFGPVGLFVSYLCWLGHGLFIWHLALLMEACRGSIIISIFSTL
jgi:hypothetical protein